MKFGAVLRKWDTYLEQFPTKKSMFTVFSASQVLTGSGGIMKDEDLKSYGVILLLTMAKFLNRQDTKSCTFRTGRSFLDPP